MEELENKLKEKFLDGTNEEIYSEDFDDELHEINKNLENVQNSANKFIQYDAYFYFALNGKEFLFQIKTDLFNSNEQYINELIKNIVKKINEKKCVINYNDTEYIVSLRDCDDENDEEFYIKNYEIKQCKKKNNLPKDDIPSYYSKSLIKIIDNKKFSFISKSSLNIMLIEKSEIQDEECGNKYGNKYYFDDDEE